MQKTVSLNKYPLLTKLVRSRWMDIAQVLFCVFIGRDEGYVLWPKRELFLAGPTREIPDGEDWPTLPARVANQNTGLASSSPHADSAI